MYITKEIFVKKKMPKTVIQTTQDTNALGLKFIYADYEIPSGAVAILYVEKPSGAEVFTNGTVDGNEVTFPFTTQTTAEAGVAQCQVKLTSSDTVLHSFIFLLDVEKTIIDDNAIESADEFGVLDTLINTVQDKITAAEAATQEALDAASQAREPVEVGARNLLLNTDVEGQAVYAQGATGPYGSTFVSNTDGILTATSSGSAFYYFFGQNVSTSGGWGLYCFEPGEFYYITGEVKSPISGTMYINERKPGNSRLTSFSTTANAWTKFSLMFQVPSNASDYMIGLAQTVTSGSSYQFRNIQLEKATVPSVYRPALEDIITNAQTELAAAVSNLTDLIKVISGNANDVPSPISGYIRVYGVNDGSHMAGLSYDNPNSSTSVPVMVIDGNRFRLAPNITSVLVDGSSSHSAHITGVQYIHNNSTGVSRLKLTIVVDGTYTHTKYIDLKNS